MMRTGNSVEGGAATWLSSDAWVSCIVSNILFQIWRRMVGKKNHSHYSFNRSSAQRQSSGHAGDRQESGLSVLSCRPTSWCCCQNICVSRNLWHVTDNLRVLLHMWEGQIQSNPLLVVCNSLCCSAPSPNFRVPQAQDSPLKLLMGENYCKCKSGGDEKQTKIGMPKNNPWPCFKGHDHHSSYL